MSRILLKFTWNKHVFQLFSQKIAKNIAKTSRNLRKIFRSIGPTLTLEILSKELIVLKYTHNLYITIENYNYIVLKFSKQTI